MHRRSQSLHQIQQYVLQVSSVLGGLVLVQPVCASSHCAEPSSRVQQQQQVLLL